MIIKSFYIFLIFYSLFIMSCSVGVRDVKQKPVAKTSAIKKDSSSKNTKVLEPPAMSQKIKQEVDTSIQTNSGSDIAKLVDYQLSKDEKDFLIKEAKSLNIQIPEDNDIEYFISYYATTKKYFTENAFKRANYFMPMVKRIFAKEGLPEELAYLGIVESGFNPFATSPSNAAGIWQFIPSTGKRFGLVIDDFIDERRDPYKSTVAAAKYLKFLYNMFGSWELAIAAYNCGEKCVQKRAESVGSYNFADIKYNLPRETMEYVPRFFAILLIAQNPQKFGLDTSSNIYDVLNTTAEKESDIEELASELKIDPDILKFYNAHFKKGIVLTGFNLNLPKLDVAFDKRFIYLPPQRKVVAEKQPKNDIKQENKEEQREDNFIIAILKKDQKPEIVKTTFKRDKIYIVEKGDTLYSIAKRFSTDVETLKRLNNLQDEVIKEGDILIVE